MCIVCARRLPVVPPRVVINCYYHRRRRPRHYYILFALLRGMRVARISINNKSRARVWLFCDLAPPYGRPDGRRLYFFILMYLFFFFFLFQTYLQCNVN